MSQLVEIINNTVKTPTIVNDTSNFVVVTYWWGRGNLNQNTARPCIAFYEDLIKKVLKFLIDMINTITKDEKNIDAIKQKIIEKTNKDNVKDVDAIPTIITNILKGYKEDKKTLPYIRLISRSASSYMNSIYEYCNIDNKLTEQEKNEKALAILEKLKSTGKTPQDFEFKDRTYVENILFLIIKYVILYF